MYTPVLKVATDLPDFTRSDHKNSNILLRELWEQINTPQMDKSHQYLTKFFQYVKDLTEADFYLLPRNWQFYIKNNQIDTAERLIQTAHKNKIPVILFNDSDFPSKIPFSGCLIFDRANYKSKRYANGNYYFSYPVFIRDYLKDYANNELQIRKKRGKAVVGFCGQAGGTILDFSKREIVRQTRRLKFKLGLSYQQPPPFETTRYRKDILNRLSKSSLIETNFLIRTRYRAGYWAPKKNPFHPTRLEFVRNILDTDYTVCMRGGGNFSVRFFETLSLGRIPVFVDTDCILPLDNIRDYRNDFVWVDHKQISQIDNIIADFHAKLSQQDFIDLQVKCRKLWEQNFTKEGFFGQFASHINVYSND